MSKAKVNERDIFFGKRLEEYLNEWLAQKDEYGRKRTKKLFAEKVGCSINMVNRWIRGEVRISWDLLKEVAKVLEKDPEDFYPKSTKEKYENDPDFVTEHGRDLLDFARFIGLDVSLVRFLSSHISFENEYQPQTWINHIVSENGAIDFYWAGLNDFWKSANIDPSLEYLQLKKGEKKMTLTYMDIFELKRIQDCLIEAATFLMFQRKREMSRRIVELNDLRLNTNLVRLSTMSEDDSIEPDEEEINTYCRNLIDNYEPRQNQFLKEYTLFLIAKGEKENGKYTKEEQRLLSDNRVTGIRSAGEENTENDDIQTEGDNSEGD